METLVIILFILFSVVVETSVIILSLYFKEEIWYEIYKKMGWLEDNNK